MSHETAICIAAFEHSKIIGLYDAEIGLDEDDHCTGRLFVLPEHRENNTAKRITYSLIAFLDTYDNGHTFSCIVDNSGEALHIHEIFGFEAEDPGVNYDSTNLRRPRNEPVAPEVLNALAHPLHRE